MRDPVFTQKDFAEMDRDTQEKRRKYPNHPAVLRGIAAEKAWEEGEREHAAKQTPSPRK